MWYGFAELSSLSEQRLVGNTSPMVQCTDAHDTELGLQHVSSSRLLLRPEHCVASTSPQERPQSRKKRNYHSRVVEHTPINLN